MDSMRHMTTSLPRASRQRTETDILSAFKAAALSVTNLYKSAAADQAHAREAGYQNALDDLLAYLDKEKLGLDDGEGWTIRKWALERLEDAPSTGHAASEDDEETKPEEIGTRSSSPEAHKKTQHFTQEPQDEDRRIASESQHTIQQPQVITVPSADDFSFRAATQMPSHHERDGSMDMESTPSGIRVTTRPNRSRHHVQIKRDGRNNSINLGNAHGKRKFPFGEFFDIGNLNFDNDKKDNGRGGKRGRFV